MKTDNTAVYPTRRAVRVLHTGSELRYVEVEDATGAGNEPGRAAAEGGTALVLVRELGRVENHPLPDLPPRGDTN